MHRQGLNDSRWLISLILLGLGFVVGRFSVHRELLPVANTRTDLPLALNVAGPVGVVAASTSTTQTLTNDILTRLHINARRVPSVMTDAEREELLTQLAALDPELALQQAWPAQGTHAMHTLHQVLLQWARRDVTAAWQWLSTHQADNVTLRLQWLTSVAMQGTAMTTLTGLTREWAQQQPAYRDEMDHALLTGLLNGGQYIAARDLVQALADQPALRGEQSAQWIEQVAETWSRYQPSEAAQWAQGLRAPMRDAALTAVVSAWADSQPRAAVEFVATLPDADRSALWQSSVAQWLAQDRSAAESWLASNGHLRDYDQALYRYVTTVEVATSTPDAALAWAERIRDEELRSDALRQVLSTIHAHDPGQADAYVRTATGLTDNERQLLLNMLASR